MCSTNIFMADPFQRGHPRISEDVGLETPGGDTWDQGMDMVGDRDVTKAWM